MTLTKRSCAAHLFISVKELIDCCRRSEIYDTNALLLLVCPNREVIFVIIFVKQLS